jgi:hypothetical protein
MASSSTTRIAPEHDETARLQAVLRKQQVAFAAEGPVTLASRIDRINRLIRLTAENGTAIVEALRADFGGARSVHGTMLTEIVAKVQGMEYARDHLAAWMKPESRQTNAPFNLTVIFLRRSTSIVPMMRLRKNTQSSLSTATTLSFGSATA